MPILTARKRAITAAAWLLLLGSTGLPAAGQDAEVRTVDQGAAWTDAERFQYYTQDEGSELIPLSWLQALRQPDGSPFLASLPRYGFLSNPDPRNIAGLPVGFTQAPRTEGPMVGLTCSACHVRQLTEGNATYRIDGAPAFIDFAAFVTDLDAAMHRAFATDASFGLFADSVLGANAADEVARIKLHAEAQVWWVRLHALVAGSLPKTHPWGPTRLDAISVIYNFLTGLDAGPPPTYVAPDNILAGDAPVRYPFLWNARRQDFTQWTGIAAFGNDDLGTARSLSEIFGVFARFRPVPTRGAVGALNRNYLLVNSASLAGFKAIDGLLDRMGAPKWPWPVDARLAAAGRAVFERPTAQGGCVECHGQAKGAPRPPVEDTWKTPIVDVGTDRRAWQALLRSGGTGTFAGANIPGGVPTIKPMDLSLDVLKIAVGGTLVDLKTVTALDHPLATFAFTLFSPSQAPPAGGATLPVPNRYEARVLHGVWAAAPFLHNGSVPTLADLLKPAGERPKRFQIGPAYDQRTVGLAVEQSGTAFTLETTGCDDLTSGNSNCGHDYGTGLSAAEKSALLEYLKVL